MSSLLLLFLHVANLLLFVHAKSVERQEKIQVANLYDNELNLHHVRTRRDESTKTSGSLDELGSSVNDTIDQDSGNLDELGREANDALGNLGKQANTFVDDASREFNTVLKNVTGTVGDFTNYANTKGQETIDDILQWFKDKLVIYILITLLPEYFKIF